MKWTNPKVIIAIIALCIGVGLATAYGVMQTQNEVVASINGENITKNQLYEELVEVNGKEALDNMIAHKVINLEMDKQNIVISDEEVQNELDLLYEYYGSETAFMETLNATGYTLDEMKRDIVTNLGIKKLMAPQISVSEEEMENYFEENKALLGEDGQAATYEDSKEAIKEILTQQKSEMGFAGWLEGLYKEHGVVNHLEK